MSTPEGERQALAETMLTEWGVKLGVPLRYPDEVRQGINLNVIDVPQSPHVFFAKTLRLEEDRRPRTTISHALVMVGHGITTGAEEEEWLFRGTKKGVSSTVRGYEQVASELSLPPLDALLVCRTPQVEQTSKVRTVFTQRAQPYVFADATVTLGDENEQWSNWLTIGEGVELIVANADSWHGLPAWRGYWNDLQELRQTREIPRWAKQPRYTS